MENAAVKWRRCRSCKGGRIALFTSIVACEECSGTGFDLSDEGFSTRIDSLDVLVRTRKRLARFGVHTIGQLFCFVAAGRLAECGPLEGSVVNEVRRLVLGRGLRVREDGVLEQDPTS